MIKIENIEVSGWEAAIRGMRNPMNSWEKSDSFIGCHKQGDCKNCFEWEQHNGCRGEDAEFVVGENDLALMKRLAKGGSVHAKYRRMIIVTCDITAPLYWWKEFDTYKVGTVANSCSTMHKIHDKEFTLDDFSHERLCELSMDNLQMIVDVLNKCRMLFLETKDKKYWWQMIQLLPSSYNQRRTVQISYENACSMHGDRRYHKIDEWHVFCDTLESLPYAEGIIYNIGG